MMYGDPRRTAENPAWSGFGQWNGLFEALCTIRGFASVNDLAHAYCDRTDRRTQRDLDTAVRNINNWRNGSHTPSARNLAVLTQILDVASDPALHEAWRTLHRKATAKRGPVSIAATAVQPAGSPTATLPQGQRLLTHAVAASVVAAAFAGGFLFWRSGDPAVAIASETSKRSIPFHRTVSLTLGQSAVVHGHRGNCGMPAPDRHVTSSAIPSKVGIGTLTAGELGVRYSRHCGGNTPAREVLFHARRVGSEKIELFGDVIAVTVTQ